MDDLKGRNTPVPVLGMDVSEKPAKQRAVRVAEIIQPDGSVAYQYSDGAIRNEKGHMLQPLPGVKPITNENAREMLSRRRAIGLRAQLEGLAEAADMDPSEIDDELLMQSGSALKALTAHMARTFKQSSSLRGMAEVYDKLAAPLVGDRRQRDEESPAEQNNVLILIQQFVQQINVNSE